MSIVKILLIQPLQYGCKSVFKDLAIDWFLRYSIYILFTLLQKHVVYIRIGGADKTILLSMQFQRRIYSTVSELLYLDIFYCMHDILVTSFKILWMFYLHDSAFSKILYT